MSTHVYHELDRASRLALVILAVGQAAVLLALHKALEHEAWPATDARWLYAAYLVAGGLPLFLYIGALRLRDRANIVAGIAAAVLLFWLGWHTGWLLGEDHRPDTGYGAQILWETARVVPLAIFIAAFLFRTAREEGGSRLPYARLIDLSWLNALTLAFLLLFLIVFWLILFLWASLFAVLGITFFRELFREPVFIYPITGLVGGLGLVVIRNRARLIATVRGMCEALMKALLPLTAFVVVIFLVALPFTGLQPLWDTGRGTALLIALALVLLFFFNAELGGESERPYVAPLRWLRIVALLLLPVQLGIAAWGLGLRIVQHGLTVPRLWAALVVAVLGAYALGYAALIVRHRDVPYPAIGRWNTVLAVVLAVLLVLVSSPVLDFRRLAASDQVARLERGAVAPEEFDVFHLRRLGAYGLRALDDLRSSRFAENDTFNRRLAAARSSRSPYDRFREAELAASPDASGFIVPLPGSDPPQELLQLLGRQPALRAMCASPRGNCRIGEFELDGVRWWATFSVPTGPPGQPVVALSQLVRWSEEESVWLEAGRLATPQCLRAWLQDDPPEELALLVEGQAAYLRIGNCAYQLLLELEPRPLPGG